MAIRESSYHLAQSSLLLFVFIASHCASIPYTTAFEIDRVIAQDKELSLQAERDIAQGMSRKDALDKMTQGMRQIDLSDCPPEFREAYIRHIQAWESFASEHGIEGFFKALLTGVLIALTSNPTPLVAYIAEQKGISQDINDTWKEVEAIAARYNVRTSD